MPVRYYLGSLPAILFLLCATCRPVGATLVDWNTLTWAPGSLSNSYDVDPGHAGNDVTVAVTGDTGQLVNALGTSTLTPAITSNLTGGFTPVHPSLQMSVDFASNAQSITITLNFSAYVTGVNNVSFNLFDIDFRNSGGNTYQDTISSITATNTTGGSIAPTITGLGRFVSLSGSGLGQTLTGTGVANDTSSDGNATISFNANNISSISFTYSSSAMFANPTYQHIALDNISFTPTPEVNAGWISMAFCGLIAATSLRRKQKPLRS
jgi:hypothetical protein